MEQSNFNDLSTNEKLSQFNSQRIFTIPNILSFFRLCLIPIIVWLYVFQKEYLLAGIVLIISGLTDIIDGFIARKFNMVSRLGKILDPVADKLTQTAVMICLLLRFPLISIPLALLILKELFMLVSGIIVIKKTNQVMSSLWHGKLATILLYLMMGIHVFWLNLPTFISYLSIIFSSVMIVISFTLYAIHNVNALISSNLNH